tara:strand:- start:7770 stop:9275 length:1506 start_codon:yes stop_codon:yes gene_type:complete
MSDKKYNRATYTGLGTGMQDRLIKGAYLSARADSPDYSWMNVIGGGIKSFKEEVDTAKANKKAEREETLAGIQTTVDGIYEAGGSMPKAYFDQAYDYTEKLRERYIAAVESGDIKLQHQIKGELNGFSTTIQSTKDSLVEGAEMWNDSSLIDESGMTDYQLAVNASFKEENAQLVDGSYKWENVNYDPSNPNSKEFFTLDDYKKALPLRDDVNKEVYLKDGQNVLDAREQWLNGEGGEFDVNTQRKKNMKIIDDSIKSVGTMQSMVHDDITGQGSFASSIQDHPEFQNIFDVINNKDGLKNQTAIGLYDKNGDGVVDFRDFMTEKSIQNISYNWDDDDNGIIDESERVNMMEELNGPDGLEYVMIFMEENDEFKSDIETMAKENLSDAILNQDNPSYNEDVTKGLLADFMTNRQSQMFYGGDETYKNLLPNPGGRRADSENYYRKGKLVINGEEITSLDQYKEMGGSYQYLKDQGYAWDNKDGKWVKTKASFEGKTAKYDN